MLKLHQTKQVNLDPFFVQATNHHQQLIRCNISDQLLSNIAVPVVFFYEKSIDYNLMIESLKEVLNDFPVFAGIMRNIDNYLHIDCNNKGVLFSITKDDCILGVVIKELLNTKAERLVNIINAKKTIRDQSPIMTIKLNYYACGGMSLGVCWHHAIGDMHTFMLFMKAWSNKANNKVYNFPLIVKDRDEYLQLNLKNNNNKVSGVRFLKTIDLLELVFYMLLNSDNYLPLVIYFSENELKNMQEEFSRMNNKKLTVNDSLCSHLFDLITKFDDYDKDRYLSVAINYRDRVKLPLNILGNFISTIIIPNKKIANSFHLAKNIRELVDNFQSLHMDFFATKEFIEKKGGIKNIGRFIPKAIDPVKRTLLITNWSKFGVYDVIFGESKPFFFTPFGNSSFPWVSSITEGMLNQGLIYSALLPIKLVKKMILENNLREIHKYRDSDEVIPDFIEELKWLL